MSKNNLSPREKEQRFYAFLVAEYLKYGSVDEVYRTHKYDLPISYPSYQRLLSEWGIVKAAGPNSRLSETIAFLAQLAEERIPLEAMYKRMPPSFRTSMATMHRIYQYVKEGAIRRVGTALVITPRKKPGSVLVGDDVSTPRIELGKPFGAVSFPMGFSRKRDTKKRAILRVLQQEVFAKQTVAKNIPLEVIPKKPKAFMYLDIADIRVSVYHLELTQELSKPKDFSSFKLQKHRLVNVADIIGSHPSQRNLRAGIVEIAMGYQRYVVETARNLSDAPVVEKSFLNRQLATVPVEVD